MEIDEKSIKDQIPYYLTQEQKVGLLEELKKFPTNMQYYLFDLDESDVLQGDAWTHFQLFNFLTGERAAVNGLVLSNTCDVSPLNKRVIPPNIVFAPTIPLVSYIESLKRNKVGEDRVFSIVNSIKLQHITNIFYMPPCANSVESIVLLDNVHSMPVSVFLRQAHKRKLSTLSQSGFYLFLIKLSMHFCRFHEGLARG